MRFRPKQLQRGIHKLLKNDMTLLLMVICTDPKLYIGPRND